MGDDDPFAKHLNHVTKYVASRSMTEATWEGTTVLNGDVVAQVRVLRRIASDHRRPRGGDRTTAPAG